ncbi:ribulose-phosphate 3-epimerase [Robiginitalea sp.]|nr:ribulose-phosphate 3-epimerase [Robiginitalea sp.]
MKLPIIAPSLLAADFGNLQRDVEMVNRSEAGWHHIDVMDGVFVPNISYGMPVIEAIQKHASLPLDVHLMIVDPDRYIETFSRLGAQNLTVHYEACTHLHRSLQHIHQAGMKAGVALNPHTPVQLLSEVLQDIDVVCLMSVNPGFGGQVFIEQTHQKIRQLRTMIEERQCNTLIEIDGGVTLTNAQALLDSGADVLVAGSLVFGSQNPEATISKLAALTAN